MDRFAAWLRRHKTLFADAGITFGLMLLAWAFINAPVNINRMQAGDWQNMHISKISTATVQKLEANAPYGTMADIDRVSGIGPAKMSQIQRHFTTWDTARSEVWYVGFFLGLILTFGCGLARHIIHSNKREAARRLEQRILNDKNVKR